MDLVDGDVRHTGTELGVVQGVVGPACLEDLGLLFHSEVLPGVARVDVFLVEFWGEAERMLVSLVEDYPSLWGKEYLDTRCEKSRRGCRSCKFLSGLHSIGRTQNKKQINSAHMGSQHTRFTS